MTLTCQAGNGTYVITVKTGALEKVGEQFSLRRRVLVVTDDGVPSAYADTVAAACGQPVRVTLPAGEGSKSFACLQRLLQEMLDASFTREDCVVAVGGGVVGDLCGFAASCYMRGIDFYNIPTTLLSQVDSSVGGKTAIDFQGVKNIVGAFYPPKGVCIDPATLQTLEIRQWRAGLAEVIKMAATCDGELFALLEQAPLTTTGILPPELLEQVIVRALQIKLSVVEQDPTEKGLRRILNFGHTVGHAIESLHGVALLHGECVALGMLPMSSSDARARLQSILARYGLPTRITDPAEQLLPYILHDKKRQKDGVAGVLVEEIGSCHVCTLSPEALTERIKEAENA